ncbi:GNAT superfamily N-acetyltransferase [Actinoplanes campanulatus]|uniref:GNAT superfamily N-acetyltransferase n=1 Tax=Actinoplanes campanulatus TaxID=113559 RepID=A0A7W5AM00_9ACTN|nr:GNAT family N-acetyltransferase [Actinoplanes campanulatus]MBB3098733.1 GNAT superfamily N-acetyltransferase [Actinoplanes campanulatus]GGN37299.1 N-acetyltransferase [Actinoplanes campanulatus]GID40764.1 N-acetyltransferase [Actinoplanes campanulatus]
MTITTRFATKGDEKSLHDLAARTFGLACPPGTTQADIDAFVAAHLSVESFARYLADPGRILLLVSVDDHPVGYSMLVRGPISDPDVAVVVDAATSIELSKFYLAPERHGGGAAAELMTGTLEAAAKTGAATCWLGVNQQNERAARFYAKHGFEVVGVKRFLVGSEWHDDHIRQRGLSSVHG